MKDNTVKVSVVIPFWEGEALVAPAVEAVDRVLSDHYEWYEIILVDDGSSDRTFSEIRETQASNSRVVGVRLSRNFGQHAALSAGLEKAGGDVLVSLDADLQCDPKDIPILVNKVREGYGVVSGWRTGRKDGLQRKIPSWVMNQLINFYTGTSLHDHGCAFKAIDRSVADQIPLMGDFRRFLTALILNLTPKVTEVPVSHQRSKQGKSSYDFWKLFDLAVDFLTTYSKKPFRIVGVLGCLLTGLGATGALAWIVARFGFGIVVSGRAQGLVCICIFAGFQFLTLWFIGEFSARTYQSMQRPPLFVVAEEVGSVSTKTDVAARSSGDGCPSDP